MLSDTIVSDQIICSAGKGTMSKADCLACARNVPAPCGYTYSILKIMYNDPERVGLHVTDLTGCLRRSWYDKTVGAVMSPSDILNMIVGTAVHSHFELTDEHISSEVPLDALGILGKTDVYTADGDIIDIKTTRWLKPSKLPYGSHSLQVNIYAALLREMGKPVRRLFIQYLDMSGPSKCRKCRMPYQMEPDGNFVCPKCGSYTANAHTGAYLVEIPMMGQEELKALINSRRSVLERSLSEGQIPEAEPSYLCDYCAFREQCRPSYTSEGE